MSDCVTVCHVFTRSAQTEFPRSKKINELVSLCIYMVLVTDNTRYTKVSFIYADYKDDT